MRRSNSNLEADILAATLRDPVLHARKLFALLEADDFDQPSCKAVFVAMMNVAKVHGVEAITYATVLDELRRHGADQDKDVLDLVNPDLGLGPIGSFEPKCRRLREIRQERTANRGMQDLMEQQWENAGDLIGAMQELQADVSSLTPRQPRTFADVLDDMVATLEYEQQHDDARVKTGLPTLDKLLSGGLRQGWLVVVGARTGVGKTTFAVQVAARAAMSGRRVLYYSLEESDQQVAERLTRYHQRVARSYDYPDLERVVAAAFHPDVRGLPFDVLQDARLDVIVNDLAEQTVEQEGVGLLVVDYAGLVQTPSRWESRVQELGEVTRVLKMAAMEYRVPVVLLAQVNRSPMTRSDKRPQLSDLRESGSLEQDADVVILLHHDDQNPASDSLRLAKHRSGPVGEMPVRFDYPVGRVEELSRLGGERG